MKKACIYCSEYLPYYLCHLPLGRFYLTRHKPAKLPYGLLPGCEGTYIPF
jgi:hypothetical protein